MKRTPKLHLCSTCSGKHKEDKQRAQHDRLNDHQPATRWLARRTRVLKAGRSLGGAGVRCRGGINADGARLGDDDLNAVRSRGQSLDNDRGARNHGLIGLRWRGRGLGWLDGRGPGLGGGGQGG